MSLTTSMQVCAKEPFTLDWSDFYQVHGLDPATDPITSSTWEVTNGTKGAEFINGAEVSVFISGGAIGKTILAKNTIEIQNGIYRDCRTIYIGVT